MEEKEEGLSRAGRPSALSFKPLDPSGDLVRAIAFRRDAFECSFGADSEFNAEEYTAWLRRRLARGSLAAFEVWSGQELIGQVELSEAREEPGTGHVNLYYLIASARGQGWADELDAFALTRFREQGLARARLAVALSNERARRFYARRGWRDRAVCADDARLMIMGIELE